MTSAKLSMCCKCGMPIGDHSVLVGDRIYHTECNPYAAVTSKDARIKELEAENARLVKENARWQENWDANVQEMSEKFRAVNIARVIAATGDDILALRERATAAEADREALMVALEPFAAAAEHYDPPEDDDCDIAWADDFTIGSLRRARAISRQVGGR